MRTFVIFLLGLLAILTIASVLFNQAQDALATHEAHIENTAPIQNTQEFYQVQDALNDLSGRFVLVRLFMREEINHLTNQLEDFDMAEHSELNAYEAFLSETNPRVTIEVADFGTMTLELFPEVAPNSVNNMIQLIENGYYDGLVFHRVISGFMIQGGWGDDTGCVIAGEFSANGFNNPLRHTRGVLSMARTNVMNSATSQFFIVHQNAPHLDGQYAAFGALVDGFDVLDRIANVRTGFQDRPSSDVIMTRVTVDLRGYTPEAPVCVTP